jgi:hypothetical protein
MRVNRSAISILLVLHLASFSGLCREKCCQAQPMPDKTEAVSSSHCHPQQAKASRYSERASLNCRCHTGRNQQIFALAPQQPDRRAFATTEITGPTTLLGLLDLSQSPRAAIPARHTHSPPPINRRLNLKI